MSSGFVIASARDIALGRNPEFNDIRQALHDQAIARAAEIWPGHEVGGLRPQSKQFGVNTIRPRDIFGGGTATFVKRYGSAGSWCNIWSYTVPEDEIHAFAGFMIPDPSLIFAQTRFELEDTRLPIADIEEAQGFMGPFAILYKQDRGFEYIATEEQRVLFKGFQERNTAGRNQRVVPIGLQLYKNKDLHIVERETGN